MATENSKEYVYFIILKTTTQNSSVFSGHICCILQRIYNSILDSPEEPKRLPVRCISYSFEIHVEAEALQLLTVKEAELLLALDNEEERLRTFQEKERLDFALTLTEGTAVSVEVTGAWCDGVIRYIGTITDTRMPIAPISGTVFGIELEGKYKGKGQNDGTFRGQRYFTCGVNCGVFAPFTRIRGTVQKKPDSPPSKKHDAESQMEPLGIGDRVTFFMEDDKGRHGTVLGLEIEQDAKHVLIQMDGNEKGEDGQIMHLPIDCVIREELLSPADLKVKLPPDQPLASSVDGEADDISLNSMVQVEMTGRKAYGTVRWIGKLPDKEGIMAGLEMEEDLGVSDGSFKGRRFFSCPARRGLFIRLSSCQPDTRFLPPKADEGGPSSKFSDINGADDRSVFGNVAPLRTDQVQQLLIGNMKGIQGHCNSCYMDAALFSLFSCSSVLDSLLFKSAGSVDQSVQTILREDIVNPLRSKGFVAERSVMKLRKKLQASRYMTTGPTFTTDEKDPEEFLNLIGHILHLEPLLKLSTGKKVQESFCYQIFLDQDSLVLPTVQQLLEHSFYSNSLKLAEVPSCLILQMPRFGKKFKMFDKIIPSLELDISDLLLENPQECVLCGELAAVECADCFRDPVFGSTGFKQFCSTCTKQVHRHPKRRSHTLCTLTPPEGFQQSVIIPREKLQLFAVLCIETSHYVSFVRHGSEPEDWIFFDSMADRKGDQDGFNVPRVQLCPEVARYLTMPLSQLASQNPREMEGVAKRLFCDAYMYLYQSPSMALYH
ncbi:ubiquitin carboxyl-terminal hydrolase CYLD [Brienomyrus brachyistius]|uniref:ubiquitin carboxyl-terminal hydrolase CYLD n=1 Tax=Brienomyrus brachyistius TaxID=42636 RepID=UPI0020B3358E|nr:ubiquitin carboxyl-terminal hydrolase CYLD [Brienomyrus brachyistius]XP_048866380.1 ubiquitin carboxyl-terminal hydrolase CYLD [Brienomyrus brachyistius]XP_048866381.1 ubiquitin carboxyl-terminal hydrolase CYLD [Brienomyrus brachyistius]XP_048866382.1 ubiquitin carboxyl-terminal hydrolase CYLD [Brienomyrus brachyistius]